MTVEEILAAMAAIIDGAAERDDDLTDEEVRQYEALEVQHTAALEAQTVEERARNTRLELRSRHAGYQIPDPSKPLHVEPAVDDTLTRAFGDYVRTGNVNADLMELRAQSVGSDQAGGFTAPVEFRNKLVDRMKAFGGIANEAEVQTTGDGRTVKFPTLDDTDNSGKVVAEGVTSGSGADLEFGEVEIETHRYVAPGADSGGLRVSVELAQDSQFDVEGLVARKLGERVGRAQARDWVVGNGSSAPQGITVPPTVPSAGFTGATIKKNDLIDAVHDVDPAYRDSAVWLFNDQTMAAIEKLEDTAGRPLIQPAASAGIDQLGGSVLLGHRIAIDQAFANYATNSTFGVFGNINEAYLIRRVQDVQLIVDNLTRAAFGQIVYTVWARAGGAVQNPNAIAKLARTT